jgi:hypothetical protein
MTQDDYLIAAREMERYGGSFAGHIARAYFAADSTNQRKLLEAFGDLFERYYRNFVTPTKHALED